MWDNSSSVQTETKAQSRTEADLLSAGGSSWVTCPFPRNGSSCLAQPQAWPAAVVPTKPFMFLKPKSNRFEFLAIYLYQIRLPAFQPNFPLNIQVK